jgi:hypothetical protein
MVHLRQLLGGGTAEQNTAVVAENIYRDAVSDTKTLVAGGVDAIMIENNYDVPHREQISPETTAMFAAAAVQVRAAAPNVPLGICVLWNDYRAAFGIAKAVNAQFIRIPTLVDTVRTAYGEMYPNPEEVQRVRALLHANGIGVFADVHVKHAEILSSYSLKESSQRAVAAGADALIVTGKWTGDPPTASDLQEVRAATEAPVIVGSGATQGNIKELFLHADGIIVGTALKQGKSVSKEEQVNLKSSDQRIDQTLVQSFMQAARG